jgi:type I restriction enzyme M protein
MQDDVYIIAADGWVAGTRVREIQQVKDKNGKLVWAETHDYKRGKQRYKSDLVPRGILIARYFVKEQYALDALEAELGTIEQELDEQKDEQGVEGGLLEDVTEVDGDKRKITAKAIKVWLKENESNPEFEEEHKAVRDCVRLLDQQTDMKGRIKKAQDALDALIAAQYVRLTEDEIKTLVVDDKWLATLTAAVQGELDRVSQTLTGRILQLAERYLTPLPQLTSEVATLAARVDEHLKKMGAVWK